MEPIGYLHDEMDVKVLILFILARIDTPLSGEELYELAFQDDSLNYFTFALSLPELVESGHLQVDDRGRYSLTDKGRRQGAAVEDSLAVPVVQKVQDAILKKTVQLRRNDYIQARAEQDQAGNWIATLRYRDDGLPVMTVSLMAPNEAQASAMAERLRKQADLLYQTNLSIAIGEKQGEPS